MQLVNVSAAFTVNFSDVNILGTCERFCSFDYEINLFGTCTFMQLSSVKILLLCFVM